MGKLRAFLDRFLLNDHEWKKKYCPDLYHYLFEMTPKEKHEAWEKAKAWREEHQKVCHECHGIHWENDCPECNGRHTCGGYVLVVNP